MALDSNLILFCWGDDNNSPDNIKFMKTLGIHGIIYDKMDQLSTKTDKVSLSFSYYYVVCFGNLTTIFPKKDKFNKFSRFCNWQLNEYFSEFFLLNFRFSSFYSNYYLFFLPFFFKFNRKIPRCVTTLFYAQKKTKHSIC